ncbi:MAG: hypothetical protein HYX60_08130 [Legionella longbeachae]|nr:hypothetical protein [Legionella longbeachae]
MNKFLIYPLVLLMLYASLIFYFFYPLSQNSRSPILTKTEYTHTLSFEKIKVKLATTVCFAKILFLSHEYLFTHFNPIKISQFINLYAPFPPDLLVYKPPI